MSLGEARRSGKKKAQANLGYPVEKSGDYPDMLVLIYDYIG
ncbi:hypothetical protein F0726_00178 [Acidithiobacillus caldus]|nr:hypothetical protein F0726_00178 [Acidithiobacillus caldus]